MSDIRAMLHEAAALPSTDKPTAEALADTDLFRARRALRRRHATRLSAGSGLVAAAALGAFVIVGPGGAPAGPSRDGTTAVRRADSSAVELVAYTGSQPVGFTLDKMPVGWTIRDNTSGRLVLAPDGADTTAASGPTSFEGTIAIMTSSDTGVPADVQLDDVQVGDRPAVIAHMKGAGDTRTLFAKQASGAYLEIQVWDGLGWDNERIADFAASVHITKDAELSVG